MHRTLLHPCVCVNQPYTVTIYTHTHTHIHWLIPSSPRLFSLGNPRSFGIVKNLVTLSSNQLPRLMLQLLQGLFLVRLSRLKMATHIPDEAPQRTTPVQLRLRLRLQPMPKYNMACALPIFFFSLYCCRHFSCCCCCFWGWFSLAVNTYFMFSPVGDFFRGH